MKRLRPGRIASGALVICGGLCGGGLAAMADSTDPPASRAESLTSSVPMAERTRLYGTALTPADVWGNIDQRPPAFVRDAKLPPLQLCQILAAQWNVAPVTLKDDSASVCSWMTSLPSGNDAVAEGNGEMPSIFVMTRSRSETLEALRLKLNASDSPASDFAALVLISQQAHKLIGWPLPREVESALLGGSEFQLDTAGMSYSLTRERTARSRYNFVISPSRDCGWSFAAARFVREPGKNCHRTEQAAQDVTVAWPY